MALAVIVLFGVFFSFCSRPTIVGRWDLDGTTIYKFARNGTGTLELMYAEYPFVYVIEGDRIYIDFYDESALDADYTFKVEGRLLFMTGGPGDAKSDFVLSRIL